MKVRRVNKTGNNKPIKCFLDPHKIPTKLKKMKKWVCWVWTKDKKGKWTKPPCDTNGNICDHQKTRYTFKQVYNAFKNTEKISGIGLSFDQQDNIFGIDIDGCLDKKGRPDKRTKDIIKWCDSYTEYTPSGNGVRIWGHGSPGAHGSKKDNIEIYSKGRYFCVTGDTLKDKKVKDLDNKGKQLRAFLRKETTDYKNGTATSVRPKTKQSKKKSKKSKINIAKIKAKLEQGKKKDKVKKIPKRYSYIKPPEGGDFEKEKDTILEKLNYMDNTEYSTWLSVGMGLHCTYNGSEEAFDLWCHWSRIDYPYYNESTCRKKWEGFQDDPNPEKNIKIHGFLKFYRDTVDDETDLGINITGFDCMDYNAIDVEQVEWVWPGRIPRGKVTIVSGPGGVAKTTFMLMVCSAITTGSKLPMDEGTAEQGNVIYCTGEDDPEDILKPRLLAAGGNPQYFKQIDLAKHYIDLTDALHLKKIESTIVNLQAKVFIFDPLTAYMGDAKDSSPAQVGEIMSKLSGIASRTECAIIGIVHFNKGNSTSSTNKVSGSASYVNSSRSVLVFQQMKDEGKVKYFMNTEKMNYTGAQPTIQYTVNETEITNNGVTVQAIYTDAIDYSEKSMNQILVANANHGKREEVEQRKQQNIERTVKRLIAAKVFNYKKPVNDKDFILEVTKRLGRFKASSALIHTILHETFGIQNLRGKERTFYLHFPSCKCKKCKLKKIARKQKNRLKRKTNKKVKKNKQKQQEGGEW